MIPIPKSKGKDPAGPDFRTQLDIKAEHIELPLDFYERFKYHMGSMIEVRCPDGSKMDFKVVGGNNGALVLDSVRVFCDKYGLKENILLDWYYFGGELFGVRMRDLMMKEIRSDVGASGSNPSRVEGFEGELGSEGVVGLKSDGSDINNVIVLDDCDEDNVDDSDVHYVGDVEGDVEAQDVVEDDGGALHNVNGLAGGVGYEFEKLITECGSTATQTLALPRAFVRNHIRRHWEFLMLQTEDGEWYECKLCWLKQRRKYVGCHLGSRWYEFVRDNTLVHGDRVHFRAENNANNVLHVRIIRNNQNLAMEGVA